MVMEFTPTSISFYAIDPSGQRTIEPKPQDVTYKDLGDTIAINFKGGGGIMAMIKRSTINGSHISRHGLAPISPNAVTVGDATEIAPW